jgi:hypothetical protein
MDLAYALRNFAFQWTYLLCRTSRGKSDALGKGVYQTAMQDLQCDVDNSTRLYILHGRLEPLEKDQPGSITAVLRHYLVLVVNAAHRKALTRMLTSQHPLVVERLRYKKRYHNGIVPWGLRRCRFGCASVETVEHGMFFRENSEKLNQLCTGFILNTSAWVPDVLWATTSSATAVLRTLVFSRDTVCQVAKFAH